jgi:hypothetical protein
VNRVVHLFPVTLHLGRGVDAKPDLVAPDLHDRYHDVAADPDFLPRLFGSE